MSVSSTGAALLETGSRLTVDLTAVRANYSLLAARAAPAECAAVVKANAYGLGVERVGPALWEAGARTFFVAHPGEARILRDALPEAVVYALNGLTSGAAPHLDTIGARPVLGSMPEIEEWSAFVQKQGQTGEAAIHIDTGMNRLGLSLEEAASVAKRFSAGELGFRPALVMSHLVIGDEPDHALTQRQLSNFRSAAALFPGVPASLANSAATLTAADFRFDLCRPGIALYGGNPALDRPNPLQPVVTLEARIMQIRSVPAGESVGYGAAETVLRPSTLAIVSAGYADGFLRAAGSSTARKGAEAMIAGQRCPLVGRVSMDLIAVDVTALPDGAVSPGDFATLIGQGITIDELAEHAGTIGYEILTRIGPRSVRIYKD